MPLINNRRIIESAKPLIAKELELEGRKNQIAEKDGESEYVRERRDRVKNVVIRHGLLKHQIKLDE